MIKKTVPILLAACVVATGCKTVVRENIISSINTGIGVSLAENPKTEMYEVKVGFIRNQFYSVPTGKNVEGGKGGTNYSNAADITPELVSGIRMESDARHLFLGVSVAENFAVGKVAVMSPAASAMYVAEARDSKNAPEAAKAAASVADSKEFVEFKDNYALQKKAVGEIKQAWKAGDAAKKTAIRAAANTRSVVPAAVPDAKFIQTLNLYLDGTPEHTDPLAGLARDSK